MQVNPGDSGQSNRRAVEDNNDEVITNNNGSYFILPGFDGSSNKKIRKLFLPDTLCPISSLLKTREQDNVIFRKVRGRLKLSLSFSPFHILATPACRGFLLGTPPMPYSVCRSSACPCCYSAWFGVIPCTRSFVALLVHWSPRALATGHGVSSDAGSPSSRPRSPRARVVCSRSRARSACVIR